MSEEIDDDVFVFVSERTGESFGVTLSEIMRCAQIAEERFLIPPLKDRASDQSQPTGQVTGGEKL